MLFAQKSMRADIPTFSRGEGPNPEVAGRRSRRTGSISSQRENQLKNLNSAVLVATTALVTLTAGCASVTSGTTQSVSVKTQRDSVDVAGANCILTNARGTYKVTTPGTVVVHRAKDDLNVKCSKEGGPDALTTVQSATRKSAVAGNILMFGLVGTLVAGSIDSANGAAYAYPDDITVSFTNPAVPTSDAGKVDASSATSAESSASNTPGTDDTVTQSRLAK